MAIITKITTQQKNQDRFNVYMDYGKGEEYAFSIDSDVLIKFQLKKGMELDDFSFMEIQHQDEIRKAYNYAIHYLARRMRSEKEIREYLVKKEIEEPVINEVLHKLNGQKYIDDLEYALSYVRTQKNTTDKGPEIIRLELKEKGIKKESIQLALEQYPFEDQVDTAILLSEKFAQKNTKDSIRIVKQKMEQMLVRKGYPYDVIQIALNEVNVEKDKDEEMEAIKYQGEKVYRKYRLLTGYEFEQKMKQALYRKGFSMEIIERYLAEIEKS